MNKTQLDKTLGTIKNYVNTTKMNYLKYTSNIDVNTLKTTGIYSLPSNCTNNGTTNAGTIIVDFNVGTPYQLWIPDNTHSLYKRNWDKTNSKWNGWANTYTGNVTGSSNSCTGNAATATKLATARTISLTGDTTGSVSFNGSANVSFETKTRQVVFVGSDTDGTAGWYKVAEQTCSGYGDTNITFMVTSTYANYNFGILQLQIRSDDSNITCRSLGWIARKGLDKSHYIVVISGMKWTLYAYQPSTRYGRLAFEILSQSSIDGKSMTWTLKFANNGTKESKAPTATVTSSDVATVNSANLLTTARTLTIGNKGKTFNGSANVSWTLDEIGAAPKSHGTHVSYGGNGSATTVSRSDHTHSYLPLSGGNLSGKVGLTTAATSTDTSQPTQLAYGLLSSYGNLKIIGNSDDSAGANNEYVHIATAWGLSPAVDKGIVVYGTYANCFGKKISTEGHTHKSLELSGNNTISLSNDTTTKWGAQKNSIHYYSTTGKLTDQPGQYGILCNFTNGDKEVHQLWLTQSNGNILHRGGNAEGWNTVSWLTLLDTANYSNYAFPKTGGTLTGKITFQDQLGGGGLSSLINCNALHKGTGNGQLITASGNHIYVGNPNTPITIEGKTHPKVNVNGAEYTMYHTGNKPSAADIGAAASGHVHHQVESLGNVTAETGANHPSQPGLSMRHVYNNGYPVPYGNVITMRGAGSNQILTEWSGSDGGAGRLYIRNKRDTSGDWSSWAQVYTSAHKPSPADIGAAASNHTHNYAASNHTHNYAASNHTHNYAAASHNHGLMHSDLGVTIANTSTDSGWSMINGSYNGFILKSVRSNQYAPAWHLGNYSAGICFGGADTKGVLSCSYDHAEARFAGGNGSKPVWWFGLQGKSGTTYNLDSFNAAKWGGYTVRTGAGATGVAGAITFSY